MTPPPSVGGLDLDSRSSGCARLGGGVGPPLGVVVEEVFCTNMRTKQKRRCRQTRTIKAATYPSTTPRGGLLRCLGARSHFYCCLDPIPPLSGGGGRKTLLQNKPPPPPPPPPSPPRARLVSGGTQAPKKLCCGPGRRAPSSPLNQRRRRLCAARAENGAQLGSSVSFGSGCGQALRGVPRKALLC